MSRLFARNVFIMKDYAKRSRIHSPVFVTEDRHLLGIARGTTIICIGDYKSHPNWPMFERRFMERDINIVEVFGW